MRQNNNMKVVQSEGISAFGGVNFVFEDFDKLNLNNFLSKELPPLPPQSQYSWKDIIYSMYSIYICGGSCIEDIEQNLKAHLSNNPFCKIPSPDTILRRLKSLAEESKTCRTKRGIVDHLYCENNRLSSLNIKVLKSLGAFSATTLTLDYDNTIVFNEKADSVLTYKKEKGYQPGVCTINTHQVVYLENRNGNSDAKSFQHQTLGRMFDLLEQNNVAKMDNFRADGASYQYEVVKLVAEKVSNFYISARNSYVEKYFTQITNWLQTIDSKGDTVWVGDIYYTPFIQQARKEGAKPKEYRLVVKRKKNKSGQLNAITQDAYDYRAIITNDLRKEATEVVLFYNKRGCMEKQFDVIKNDFGWNNMPFSNLSENTVFLYLMAICKNLYHVIIQRFSKRFKGLKSTYRMKKFTFRFIILPSKWIKKSRQNILRIYGRVQYRT